MKNQVKILSIVFVLILGFSIIPIQYIDAVKIPPTPAFSNATTSNDTIQAKNYKTQLNFIGIGPIKITGSDNSKTVYFNATLSNGTTITPITCTSNYAFTKVTSSGIFTCSPINSSSTSSGNIGTITGASNLGTSGTAVFSGISGSLLQFFKLISGNSNCVITVNSTNVIFTCNSITSINSQTGPAYNIVGTLNNVTVTNSTNQGKINLGSRVVIIDGSNQEITKGITTDKQIDLNSFFVDDLDNTKKLGWQLSGITSGKILTISPNQTTTQHLNIPNTVSTSTFQMEFNTNETNGGNRTGLASATPVMHGLKTMITTKDQGKINVYIGSGWASPSRSSTGCRLTIQYGTGSPPNAGNALTGTRVFNIQYVDASGVGAKLPINLGGWISGLSINTKYWVDIGESNVSGTGTCNVNNPSISLTGY